MGCNNSNNANFTETYVPTPYDEHIPRLCLVLKDSNQACIFYSSVLEDLNNSKNVILTLSSHPGYAIVSRSPVPINFDSNLVFVELGIGKEQLAVSFDKVNNIIKRANDNRILDVSYGKLEENNTLNILSARLSDGTQVGYDKLGLAHDFIINDNEHTISPLNAPQYVLGISRPRLILVNNDSPYKLVFKFAFGLEDGKTHPLEVHNFSGYGIVKATKKHKTWYWNDLEGNYIEYFDLVLGPVEESIHVTYCNEYICLENDNKVLDLDGDIIARNGLSISSHSNRIGVDRSKSIFYSFGRKYKIDVLEGTISPIDTSSNSHNLVLGIDCLPESIPTFAPIDLDNIPITIQPTLVTEVIEKSVLVA